MIDETRNQIIIRITPQHKFKPKSFQTLKIDGNTQFIRGILKTTGRWKVHNIKLPKKEYKTVNGRIRGKTPRTQQKLDTLKKRFKIR